MKDLQLIGTDELEDEAIMELPAREAMSLINTTVVVVVDVDINQCHSCHAGHHASQVNLPKLAGRDVSEICAS
jgi:hypothetical protein